MKAVMVLSPAESQAVAYARQELATWLAMVAELAGGRSR
jgi:hypothetical protein